MTEVDPVGAVRNTVADWLERRGAARNTVAAGMVILDRLSIQCPVSEGSVFTSNGEIIGARGAALRRVFARWGIPENYLKEVTTRQAAEYARDLLVALDWGRPLERLSGSERVTALEAGMDVLREKIDHWFTRKKLRLDLSSQLTPAKWIADLLVVSRDRSAGVVEQHIVGAKLERRFPDVIIDNHPAHAADRQTGREGDYNVSRVVYHVTANPTQAVIDKCLANVNAGKHPVLVVPRAKVENAKAWAGNLQAEAVITVIALEDFIALNVIEIAIAEGKERIDVMREIINAYNRRLKEVETDFSLMIELD